MDCSLTVRKKRPGDLVSFVFTLVLICLMISAIAPGVNGATNVNLGLASNYAILAESGISATGPTNITGNIGISPNNSTAITGFTLTLNPSNQFSTSPLVAGRIFAADHATPTPSLLTTAVSNMQTAYTDAAGRAPVNATNLSGGNLSGLNLTPGIYNWSTDVQLPTATNLTLDAQGNASAVWIFQLAGNLTIGNTSQVALINGTRAENIYWQVAGSNGVIIGTGSQAGGIILSQAAITMRSGSSLNGSALSQTAVTVNGSTIMAPVVPVVANFTGTPINGIAPLTVQFSDQSTNAPTSWSWTFGDGSSVNATVQNPVHTYQASGTYNVSLTASNAGGSNTSTRTNYIVVSAAPVTPPAANFTGTPTSGTAPLAVTFTDLSANVPTVWSWTFGDGSSVNATAQNPVHTYLAPGTYTVSLTASNAGGSNTSTRTNYIVVSAAPVTPPAANFTGTPTSGTAPLAVTFTDLSANVPTVWSWTFGDGRTENSTVQNPVHTYLVAGNYNVSLTASNAGGSNTSTRVGYINVTVTRGGMVGVYRPSTHTFYLRDSGYPAIPPTVLDWGLVTDLPVIGDWNGDTITEVGVYRPSTHTFYLRNSGYPATPPTVLNWGLSTDLPVTGDWNGDTITEVGVYRPSTHTFYLRNSGYPATPPTVLDWGLVTDQPVTGDWNGDTITEMGVYRPSTHTFYLRNSGYPATPPTVLDWGLSTDLPVTGLWR